MRNLKLKVKNSKLGVLTLGTLSHPLFSGSAIMIVGSNFANFISYIYHLVFGRILEPAQYGELAAAISLVSLFTVSFTFLSVVIVKFISAADEKDIEKHLSWFTKKAALLGVVTGGLALIASPFFANFLRLDIKIVSLIGPIIFFSIFSLVFRSVLQGLLKFKEAVIMSNFDMLGRLLLGVLFVSLGWSVFGAIFGLLVTNFLSVFLSRFFVRGYKILGVKENLKHGKKVITYALPILLSSLAVYSFFSTDVILVKHFFDAHDAGIYASLSTLGKIIFFGAAPVSSVMFPMVSKRHSRGEGYKRIFLMSMALVGAISGGVLLIYLVLPELAIRVLYGSKYLEAAPHLFLFGLFMTIFTQGYLLLNFFLSKDTTKVVLFSILGALIQAVGIWYLHDSIFTVIKVSVFSASVFTFSLLIYFFYDSKRKIA